jgi:hypothetical protein
MIRSTSAWLMSRASSAAARLELIPTVTAPLTAAAPIQNT